MTKERLEAMRLELLDVDNKHSISHVIQLRVALSELIAAYEKAIEYLELIEWTVDLHTCIECGNHKKEGHAPDCELNNILIGE